MKLGLTGNSNPEPTFSFSSLNVIPIFASPIPTVVICRAGSVEVLSLESGSGLGLALVVGRIGDADGSGIDSGGWDG